MSSIGETLFSFYFKQNLVPQLYLEIAIKIQQKIKKRNKSFYISNNNDYYLHQY